MTPVQLSELSRQAKAKRDLPSPSMCRAIREDSGVGVGALADAIGVSRQTINCWERGAYLPTGRRLVAYVEALEKLRSLAREAS